MAAVITGGEGDLAQAIVQKMAAELKVHSPGRAMLDVASEASVEAYFGELEDCELLVCNAGITLDSLLLKMGESEWDRVLDVNLKGAFLCAKAAVKKMLKARRGHIIFIGSYSAFQPPSGQANYAAAKSGLVGLAKSLAQEVGVRGVRVNVVVPGWLETKMTAGLDDVVNERAKSKHVLGEFNKVEAVAAFVKTLHQDMLYTSGQVFHLDSRILP